MKFVLCKFIFLISIWPCLSFSAESKSSGHKLLLLDANALFGWGSSKIATDTSIPSIGSFNLGLNVGANIKKFSLGASYDYRILTQYSSIDPTVGNRRGNLITPLSVFVRLNFEKIRFGLSLVTSGTYEMTDKTSTGQSLSYLNPSGFRFEIILKKFPRATPMFFYETIGFSTKSVDGFQSALSDKLTYTSFGVGAKYEF